MRKNVSRGVCPNCKNQISWFQAGFIGINKDFQCHHCGATLSKISVRPASAIWAIIGFWTIYLRFGYSIISLIVWLMIAFALLIDSRYRTPIKISDVSVGSE